MKIDNVFETTYNGRIKYKFWATFLSIHLGLDKEVLDRQYALERQAHLHRTSSTSEEQSDKPMRLSRYGIGYKYRTSPEYIIEKQVSSLDFSLMALIDALTLKHDILLERVEDDYYTVLGVNQENNGVSALVDDIVPELERDARECIDFTSSCQNWDARELSKGYQSTIGSEDRIQYSPYLSTEQLEKVYLADNTYFSRIKPMSLRVMNDIVRAFTNTAYRDILIGMYQDLFVERLQNGRLLTCNSAENYKTSDYTDVYPIYGDSGGESTCFLMNSFLLQQLLDSSRSISELDMRKVCGVFTGLDTRKERFDFDEENGNLVEVGFDESYVSLKYAENSFIWNTYRRLQSDSIEQSNVHGVNVLMTATFANSTIKDCVIVDSSVIHSSNFRNSLFYDSFIAEQSTGNSNIMVNSNCKYSMANDSVMIDSEALYCELHQGYYKDMNLYVGEFLGFRNEEIITPFQAYSSIYPINYSGSNIFHIGCKAVDIHTMNKIRNTLKRYLRYGFNNSSTAHDIKLKIFNLVGWDAWDDNEERFDTEEKEIFAIREFILMLEAAINWGKAMGIDFKVVR